MSPVPDPSIEQNIDKLFEPFRETPGCVVGVTRQGTEVFAKAYGIADMDHGIPLSRTSSFFLASVSKQFTAMALLLLAEEGKVSLTDSIRATIPELPAYADGVTLKHLLNHTSGIRDYYNLGRRAGYHPRYVYTEHNVLNMVCRQKNLNFQPGSELQYSNSGYVLISMAIHRASGMTLDEYAQERILKPLGMTSTRFQHDHSHVVPNRVYGYISERDEWHTSNSMLDVVGDGGMYSTIDDMLKWAANFDKPVVGKQALQQMQTKARLNSGEEKEYGMGLEMENCRGLARVRGSGGHGGYRTNIEHYPTERLTVILLCNNTSADFFKLTLQVAEQYLGSKMTPEIKADDPKSPEITPAAVVLNEDQLRQYEGEYWNGELRSVYRIFIDNGALWFEASDDGPKSLVSLGADKARNEDYGLNFTFCRNSGGDVNGLTMQCNSVREIYFQKIETTPGAVL